jgi:other hect domain ubiquitin protein ligase E3
LLELCAWDDLQLRVCGLPLIDVALLRRHTEYSGVQPHAAHVLWFWQVLEEMVQEDRRAFVRFAWAQERLPSTDAEFERTGTRMMIKPYTARAGTAVDDAFPKADTCFFNLMLPAYSSADLLRKRLLFAIHTDADSMNADIPDEERERNARRRDDLLGSSSVGGAAAVPPASSSSRSRGLGFLDFLHQ